MRLFRNGRNQAVRIPRDMELPGREALIRKEGETLVLVPFSTRLPAAVLDRLRVATRQLGLHQGVMTAAALDMFLLEEGF